MSDATQIHLTLEQEDDYAFRIRFEDTALEPLLSDEPAPLGHDRGPSPARLLLAGVANCLVASLLFALRKQHNAPGRLRARITATPVRNAEGRGASLCFVDCSCPSDESTIIWNACWNSSEFCIVTQSVRQGIDVAVTVKDAHGHVLLGDKSFEAGS